MRARPARVGPPAVTQEQARANDSPEPEPLEPEPPEEPGEPSPPPARPGAGARRRRIVAAVGALWLALLAVVALRGPLADLGEGPGTGEPGAGAATERVGRLRVRVRDAEGTPLADARVAASIPRQGRTPVVAEARAGDDGQATLEGLPLGVGRLTVSLPGFEKLTRTVRIRSEEHGILDLELPPGGALEGAVVDEEGAPIAGATVRSRPEDDDAVPPWEAATDREGRFAFDTLRRGMQRLEAEAEGYDTTGRRVGTGETELRLVLRRTGEVAGIVSLPDGAPAEGAQVVLAGSGVWPARRIETDAAGTFRITGVPGGIYEVRASRGTTVAEPREGIHLGPGQRMQLHFRLAPGATLRGAVVRAEDDSPIAGAEVLVGEDALAFTPAAVRTGEDGTFAVSGLRPVPHRVSIHAEGYVSVVAEAREPGGDPARFALRRSAILAGVVVDEQDRPVAGAQVEAVGTAESGGELTLSGAELAFREALFHAQLEGPLPVEPSGELGVTLGAVPPIPLGDGGAEGGPPAPAGSFVTDSEGRFRLTGVPPGRLQLVARHPSYAPGESAPVLVTEGSVREEITIRLPAGGSIDGRVVDERGFPIGHVRVEMHGEHEPYPRMALAAEDGTFRFEGALGTTTLTAYPSDRPAARKTLPVRSGEELEVELRLEGELVILAARTVDSRGFPVPGVRVTLRSLRASTPVRRVALSGEDGTLELVGLPPPPWRVEAEHDDYASVVLAQVGSAEEELRVTLPSGAAIRGEVRDGWEDAAVAGALVTLRGGARVRRTRTDAEGKFELPRLPAGDYELLVEHEGYLPAGRPVALAAGPVGLEDLEIEPVELARGGAVSGEVVDAVGAPVAGAEVAWGDPPGWAEAVRTDARGGFSMHGLPPGDVSVVARHPAAGETEQPERARVRAREETPGLRLRLAERFDASDVELGGGRRTGVAVAVRDAGDEVRIASVVPRSRAARGGLRPGDVMVSVDDEPALTAAHARAMLRGPAGTEAIVEVRRRGRTTRIPVEREAYTE